MVNYNCYFRQIFSSVQSPVRIFHLFGFCLLKCCIETFCKVSFLVRFMIGILKLELIEVWKKCTVCSKKIGIWMTKLSNPSSKARFIFQWSSKSWLRFEWHKFFKSPKRTRFLDQRRSRGLADVKIIRKRMLRVSNIISSSLSFYGCKILF